MAEQQEEKSGTGIIGAGAAAVVGAGAGKLMLDRQANNLIVDALEGSDAIFKEGGKKAEFASKLSEVAGKTTEGMNKNFADRLLDARSELAKTGEEALKGDAKKAAKVAQKEALAGIKAGMKEAKMPVWRNITAGQIGKVALVAVPAAIATKVALDAMLGTSKTARLEQEAAPAAGASR